MTQEREHPGPVGGKIGEAPVLFAALGVVIAP